MGLRGPGETKLETDRRRINKRIAKLRREIAAMDTIRATKRGRRMANEVPSVALVGYTNAGKSSILNAVTGAGVLVEDALFATLDPTTRRTETPDGRVYTLTDTVGFVRHLRLHQLVDAFRSTLDEAADADLLLHVVDGAAAAPEDQVVAVREVLAEIAVKRAEPLPPELVVINKADIADEMTLARLRNLLPDAVVVSAHSGQGIDTLLSIAARLPKPETVVDVVVPYTRGELVAKAYAEGEVPQRSTAPRARTCGPGCIPSSRRLLRITPRMVPEREATVAV